ncbi:sirohydrochlorin chelatase [Streptomyces sp. WMMB 322]|uniref:sirohydrochlorin chelatase n=1 Tax=Streptomyces sp. WMMB 322 TaxID=1286821 RepID=UPI000823C7DB|nr:sirohydrochlorin chelatase [Streptomyces sp. WMMB 322]SCK22414.1 sirohydrochlorin cobaltochelatase [Streptomyces sp. WMMB 322]
MTHPPALLLVGHGVHAGEDAEDLRSFAGDLAERNPDIAVAVGLGELSPPAADSVAGLVERGVRNFAAVPLMLTPDSRAKDDILAALAREEERHPGISCTCGRAPGPDPALLPVLERRIEEALDGGTGSGGRAARSPGDRAGTTVLLVGRGSTEPDANAELHRAARLLWEGRGYAGVEVAFVSLAAPDVASGLDRCRKLGAKRVVLLPYFIFEEGLPERARMQAQGWSAANPDVDVVNAGVIGATGELADVVLQRYREAAGDGPRACCEASVHPVTQPGAGDGSEQPTGQPHSAPHDGDRRNGLEQAQDRGHGKPDGDEHDADGDAPSH